MNTWIAKYGTVASLALSLTALGCGDDNNDDNSQTGGQVIGGGTGGNTTGATGGSTAEGTGGSTAGGATAANGNAGGGATGGGQCTTAQAEAAQIDAACAACVCTNGPDLAVACSGDANNNCWNLIACVGAKCAGLSGDDRTTCAATMCGEVFSGAALARPVGEVINGVCAQTCGVGDAGGGTTGDASGGTTGDASGGTTGDASGGTTGSADACTTTEATSASIPEACASCVCTADAAVATTCNGVADNNCWKLVACVATNCPGKMDAERDACAIENCVSFLGGAAQAPAVGEVIAASCSAECGG